MPASESAAALPPLIIRIRNVPALAGLAWIARGFRTFARRPGGFLGLFGLVLLALLVLAAAIASKVLGCGAAALSLGWRNALRVGVGMVPRGEVAMIAAQLGLTIGVLGASAYSVIVFVVVGTALVTPLLLQITFAVPAGQESRQQASPAK